MFQILRERAADGGLVPLDDEEEFRRVEQNCSLYFGKRASEGVGVLYVTTRRLVWLSVEDATKGYSFDYTFIPMHSISRDLVNFPYPCIYCHLDSDIAGLLPTTAAAPRGQDDSRNMDQTEDDEEDEQEEDELFEMRFVPVNPDTIPNLFKNISECAALNPDPEDDEDAGELICNEAEVAAGAAADGGFIDTRQTQAAYWDSLLNMPQPAQVDALVADGRFDDPDEDDNDDDDDDDGDAMQ